MGILHSRFYMLLKFMETILMFAALFHGVTCPFFVRTREFIEFFTKSTIPMSIFSPGRFPTGLLCGFMLLYVVVNMYRRIKFSKTKIIITTIIIHIIVGPILILDPTNGFAYIGTPPIFIWANLRLPQEASVSLSCPAFQVCFDSSLGVVEIYGGLMLHNSLPYPYSFGPG
jgi:hypothetical protein